MPDKVRSSATRFVDFALKHSERGKVKNLPTDEAQTLFFDVVSAAGFDPQKVIPGRLVGHYLDQDGSRTGGTYPINGVCPFKVVDEDGDDNYFATGWLDCALWRVVSGTTRHQENREKLVDVMIEEIERSIPLEPVQLTPDGDLLLECPPHGDGFGFTYFVHHTRDKDVLDSCVGVHAFCEGWMDRGRSTRTHDVIMCRSCHLRALFPRKVKTYGELRRALKSQQARSPA